MGIFKEKASGLFARYRATIQFRDKLMAGVPMNPKLMTDWIAGRTGLTDQDEVFLVVKRTMEEMGIDVSEVVTPKDLVKIAEQIANTVNTCGFKHDDRGLFIEGRQVKAMLKEAINILYVGEKWGKTEKKNGEMGGGKIARNYTAERVFVDTDRIYLDREAPNGTELIIGHVVGRQGPQNTLTMYQYVSEAVVSFDVLVLADAEKELTLQRWAEIWSLAEENGLGALRSQSFGKFDIVQWQPITGGVA